jgi:thymidylate synthase (FAD)
MKKVKLVTNTPNAEETIVEIARVSSKRTDKKAKPDGLINYLIKHKHWSPLEMVSATMEIEATRDIARQLLRHRSFSFQEFSQRYANVDEFGDNMFELCEARLQDTKNRQNSIPTDDIDLKMEWMKRQAEVQIAARKAVEWAANKGIAKEIRRAVLPEGLTTSRLYMNGTIRSWIHYVDLRSGNGTQKEHMEVARACAAALEPVFPDIKDFIH